MLRLKILLTLVIVISLLHLPSAASAADEAIPLAQMTADQALPPLSLSLAEAVQQGLVNNPVICAATARVQEAEARLRAARAPLNPILALAHGFGHDTGGLDEDILLAQTIEYGPKRNAPIKVALAERSAAVNALAGTVAERTFTIQTAYWSSLQARDEHLLAQEVLAVAQAFANAASIQFQAGDVARSQVVRSQLEVNNAQQALLVAAGTQANREAELRSLLGVPPNQPLQLTEPLGVQPVAYRLSDLLTYGLAHRPDLLAAQYQLAARTADIQRARSLAQADFFWEARRMSLDPSVTGESIRFGIIFPLIDLGRIRAEIQLTQATAQEQQANNDELLRVARLNITTAWQTLEQVRQVLASFQPGRIAQAKELLDMAQLGYQHGATSYLELLDAQRVYREEQTNFLRAQVNYRLALATLQQAVGGCLP